MATTNSPNIYSIDGTIVLELGPESSHLYENQLGQLEMLPMLAASVEPAQLVVDLSEVELIGSAAIGRFVAASRTLRNRGGGIALANTNSFCRVAIAQTNLDSMLPSFGSPTAAVSHLNRVGREAVLC